MKPTIGELIQEFEQHYFLQGHKRNDRGYWSVFPSKKSIGIDKFTGPELALLISLYSQGNMDSLCLHMIQYSESQKFPHDRMDITMFTQMFKIQEITTLHFHYFDHICAVSYFILLSPQIFCLYKQVSNKKTQPSGHEIKAYLSLVNYYRTTYPQAFFLQS